MVKGLVRSLRRGNASTGAGGTTTIPIRDKTLTVDGASGIGWGTVVIGDFPEGNILFQGAAAYFTFTGPTTGDLADDWEGDFGIGTTPAVDATLTNADVDIIAQTPIAAATAEVSPYTRGTSATSNAGAVHDNTDGSLEINLSLLIDDADISADDIDITCEGVLFLSYKILGDD